MQNFMLILFVVFFTVSCNSNGILKREEKNDDSAVHIDPDDRLMEEAQVKARETYSLFLKEFNNSIKDSSKTGFAIKMRFDYNESSGEHMWINQLFYEKNEMYGVLDNEPFYVPDLKIGDTIRIEPLNISDWVYFSGDTVKGGYTVRVLYKYSSPEEKIQIEESYGPFIK